LAAGRKSKKASVKKRLTESEKLNIEKIFLKRIEIKNFKAITDLALDFPDPRIDDSKLLTEEPWLLLLGENGVGKSTLLQAIALTLMGSDYLKRFKIKPLDILNRKAKAGWVKLFYHGGESPFKINFNATKITCDHTNTPTYLLGYGSTRLSFTQGLETERIYKNVKVKNLFIPESALTNASKWIVSLNNRAKRNSGQKKIFDWVGLAVKDLLLLQGKEKMVVENGKVLIQYSGSHKSDLTQLSDGYKSVVTVAVDIIQALIRGKATIETAQGIVLIDEIGTHLHPRWKMQVVTRLRKVFPHVQFIVTTHDPLCLRGLKKGEIAVFTKHPATKKIQALTDLPDPSGMNAEQLLSSQFFGLDSTYDWEDEEKFNEYYYLLSRKLKRGAQERRIKELESFVKSKRAVGNSLFEQTMHKVIDEEIAEARFVKPKSAIKLKDDTMKKIKSIWR
jgi:energy-coupling factor transporter ATP-binding protein EcfA2